MEAPLLRVSRPVSACSRCRNAKTKCDGKLPACTACERSNRAAECSSANDQFAKGKERSYVASLESRIERLEVRLAQAKRRKSSAVMLDFGGTQALFSTSQIFGGRRKIQRKEASDMDELVSDFGFLAVNATARDFHGFIKEMSFARLVLTCSSLQDMPHFSTSPLPPRAMGRDLISQCLSDLLGLYPIVTDTSLFGSFEAVYQQKNYSTTPFHSWNIRFTLAIALISHSHGKDDNLYQEAIRHVSSALELAEDVLQPGSIAGLQAVLFLGLYAALDPAHFNSWYLIGVASRMMVDLGLHQESVEDMRTNNPQQLLRRRIFYCVYSLDRACSLTHVRPFSFSDSSTNMDHPLSSLNNSPSIESLLFSDEGVANVSGDHWLQLLALRKIQSTWFQSIFQSDREAMVQPWQTRSADLNDMQTWARSLPNTTPTPLKHLFLSEMLFSSVLLLCPLGSPGILCPYGRALVFDNAVRYSEVIHSMCDTSHGYNLCNNYDVLRTLFVANALLGILGETPGAVYYHIDPVPPTLLADSVRPPLVRSRGRDEIVEVAVDTLTRIDLVLSTLGRRFVYPFSYGTFKFDVSTTLQRLHEMQQRQDLPIISHSNGLVYNGIQSIQTTPNTTRTWEPSTYPSDFPHS